MTSNGTSQDGNTLSDLFFTHGCIVNSHGVPDILPNSDQINENPVFDAMRRWSQWFRIIARSQFIGYAVEDGKSILWFKRLTPLTQQDLWQGIADEIKETAPAGQLSNRWLLDFDLIPFHPSESSEFKASAFADYWGIYERCMGFSYDVGGDAAMLWHGALGQKASGENLMSEYPTGYRYARLDNPLGAANDYVNQGASADFYKSCRLYEPAIEVESAVTSLENDEYVVKVTMKSRLWNTAGEVGGAPDSIDRDISGWTDTTIADEPFRTPENGLRLYLLNQSTSYNPTAIAGDRGYNTGRPTNNPYAAIYPRFFLTRLIPEPHPDTNSTQDPTDTPLWSDVLAYAELVLRAICEGYVDDVKTSADICEYYDANGDTMPASWKHTCWTWENVCYAAFGGRWVTLTPSVTTGYTDGNHVREEMPQGFGPVPNQALYAEMFNQLASIVDLLDKVRVMLPYELQEAHEYYSGSRAASGTVTCGTADMVYGTPPGATISTGSVGYSPVVSWIAATQGAELNYSGGWVVETSRDDALWKFSAVDSNAIYAIPDTWSDMLDTRLGGIFHRTMQTWLPEVTGVGGGGCSVGANYVISSEVTCLYLSPVDSGTITAPPLPTGWSWYDAGPPPSNSGPQSDVVLVPLALQQEPILVVPLVTVTRDT